MKKRVLILCTGNSCRSQMAEGALKHYGNQHFDVESAGSKPSVVNTNAIIVMQEIGIDISTHRSKHLDEFKGQHFDFVITVCDHANDVCPVFPGTTQRLHWPFPDPPQSKNSDESTLIEFRKVRDLIAEKFQHWVASRK